MGGNKVGFQCILRIWGKHEYTCNSENNFQTITISSFYITQRAVKASIIANLLKIIKNTEVFFILKRKGIKYMLENVHFGEKWPFLQPLDANGRGQNSSKWLKILHAVLFHVYKEIKRSGGKF